MASADELLKRLIGSYPPNAISRVKMAIKKEEPDGPVFSTYEQLSQERQSAIEREGHWAQSIRWTTTSQSQMGSVHKSINFSRRGTVSPGIEQARRLYMDNTSAAAAEALSRGENPTGNFVVTDDQFLKGTGLARGDIFSIASLVQGEDGKYEVQYTAGGALQKLNLPDMKSAADFIASTRKILNTEGKTLALQMKQQSFIQSHRRVYNLLFGEDYSGYLGTPESFRKFINAPYVPIRLSKLASRDLKIASNIYSPLRAQRDMLNTLLNTFEANFERDWKSYSYAHDIASFAGMKLPELKAQFKQAAFERMTEPVFDSILQKVRWAQSPGIQGLGNYGVPSAIFNARAAAQLPALLAQNAQRIGIGSTGSSGIKAKAAQKTWMRLVVETMAKWSFDRKRFTYNKATPEDYGDVQYVFSRLSQLDEIQRGEGRGFAAPGFVSPRGLVDNRAAAFLRAHYLLKNQMEAVGHEIKYRFQEADPFLKTGYGVFFNIIPRGQTGIVEGSHNLGAQFFMDIEDPAGISINDVGSAFVNRSTIVTDFNLRQPHQPHLKDYARITQGYRQMSVYNDWVMKPNTSNEMRMAVMQAAKDRQIAGGKLHVFSSTETKAANLALVSTRMVKAIAEGRYDEASRLGSKAVGFGSISKGGTMINIDPRTQEAMVYRLSVSMPDANIVPPNDAVATAPDRLSLEGIERLVFNTSRDLPGKDKYKGASPNEIKVLDAFKNRAEFARALENWPTISEFEDERYPGLAAYVMKNMGFDPGMRANRIEQLRRNIGKNLGLALHGTKPANFRDLVMPQLYEDIVPLGWGEARPVQWFDNIPLDRPGDELAMTELWKVESPWGQEFSDSRFQRNIGTGILQHLEELDEADNVIKRYDENDALRVLTSYEQQALVHESASKDFGAGTDLTNLKLFLGTQKATVAYAGNRVQWDDDFIKIWGGVPPTKLIEKHADIRGLIRGWTALLMTQDSPEKMGEIKAGLNSIFASKKIHFAEDVGSRYLVARAESGKHFIRTKEEALDILDKIEELASKHGISLYGQTQVRMGNRRFRAYYVKQLTTTSINNDPHPGFKTRSGKFVYQHELTRGQRVTAGDVLVGGEQVFEHEGQLSVRDDYGNIWPVAMRSLNPNRNVINTQVRDILRMRAEGLISLPDAIRESLLSSTLFKKTLYQLRTHSEALEANWKGKQVLDATDMTPEEIELAKTEAPSSGVTYEEYLARYGSEGTRRYTTVNGKTINIPGEVATPQRGNIYKPSSTKLMADRLIRYDQSLRDTDTPVDKALMDKHITAVQDEIKKAVTGDEGFASRAVRKLQLSGRGFLKASLQQDPYAFREIGRTQRLAGETEAAYEARVANQIANDSQRAFTAWVSPDLAKQIGATHQWGRGMDSTLEDEEGKYFWSTVHRSPQVTSGRMAIKVRIDPELKGYGLYVHDSIRDVLLGDSDGDKVAMILAGAIKGISMTPERFQQMSAEMQAVFEIKRQAWKERMLLEDRIRSRMDTMPTITTARGFIQNIRDTGKPFQTSLSLAESHSIDAAQGLIGSATDILQERLLNISLAADTYQETLVSGEISSGIGLIRELFLKTKTVKEQPFDPYELVRLMQGRAAATEKTPAELGLTTEEFKKMQIRIPQRGHGVESPISEQLENYFRTFLLKPAQEKAAKGEEIPQARQLETAMNFLVGGQRAFENLNEDYKARLSQKNIFSFYDIFTKDSRGKVDKLFKEDVSQDATMKGINELFQLISGDIPLAEGANRGVPQVPINRQAHWLGEPEGTLLADPTVAEDRWYNRMRTSVLGYTQLPPGLKSYFPRAHRPTRARMPGDRDIAKGRKLTYKDPSGANVWTKPEYVGVFTDAEWEAYLIQQEKMGRKIPKRLYPKIVSTSQVQAAAEEAEQTTAQAATQATTTEAREFEQQVVQHLPSINMKNVMKAGAIGGGIGLGLDLALAGLGGGGALYAVFHRKKNDTPSSQDQRMVRGKTRVMATGPGTVDGYNIQVRAVSDNAVKDDREWGGQVSQALGDTVNIQVSDKRTERRKNDKQSTIAQLKGR